MGISSLGRYQVRGVLGRETMGIVYRGYDPVLDRGQVDTSLLQTLFRAEPRTARSEERRKRLP